MSGGPQPVLQAAVSDGLSLDPFSFGQDGWTASEVDDLMALRVLASRFARRLGPYLSGERRTLDFRDSPVRTPRQNPVHASWPAACAANWARNVAVAPSTPGFRARPYWQIRRPCCSRWDPREPDSGGRRSLPAPFGSLAHIPSCTRRSTPHRPRLGRTCGQSATPAPYRAPAFPRRPGKSAPRQSVSNSSQSQTARLSVPTASAAGW